MTEEKILTALDEFFTVNRAEMIADTAALVSINSVRSAPAEGRPFGDGCAKALDAAGEILKKHGFCTQNHNYYFLTAESCPEAGEAALGILAHLDVVEAGEGWTYPPYALTLKDNIMYGRGTSDDKGPAIAAIYALKAAMNIAGLSKNVRIILGSGEETGSEDMDYYRKVCKMPPMVFSPDADFPLINIEKGRYAPSFRAEIKKITSDAAKNDIKRNANVRLISFQGGETANIVPQKAKCVLSGISAEEAAAFTEKLKGSSDSLLLRKVLFDITEDNENHTVTVTAVGKGAHAAFPEGGVNAQTALIKLLCLMPLSEENDLRHYISALDKLLPFDETDGASLGIKMEDGISGELTAAFTVLSIKDDIISGRIDIRSPVVGNTENVAAVTNAAFESFGFRVGGETMTPPHCTDENSVFVETLLSAYETVTGSKGKCLSIGGGTYVHNIDGGVAFGCAMPDTDYRIHGADEFMPVGDMITSAKIFALAIIRLCS